MHRQFVWHFRLRCDVTWLHRVNSKPAFTAIRVHMTQNIELSAISEQARGLKKVHGLGFFPNYTSCHLHPFYFQKALEKTIITIYSKLTLTQ